MLFARLAAFALPILGAIASPVVGVKDSAAVQKRGDILAIVTNLQNGIAGPIASINVANGANVLSANDASVYLNDILNCINVANTAIGSISGKSDVDLLGDVLPIDKLTTILARQNEDDLNEVGQVLAKVIQEIVEAVEGIADDLKALPLLGGLITAIDSGLSTVLLGVEVVLVGVVQIVQGILGPLGLGGLLSGLGLGLLVGILFP